jgi:hypothetical protein
VLVAFFYSTVTGNEKIEVVEICVVTRSQIRELWMGIHYSVSLLLVLYMCIKQRGLADLVHFMCDSFCLLFMYLHSWCLVLLLFSTLHDVINAWD